jgi:hypothetical protein
MIELITHLAAFYDPKDPLTNAGGLSPEQQKSVRGN